jgi:hypothetical protein
MACGNPRGRIDVCCDKSLWQRVAESSKLQYESALFQENLCVICFFDRDYAKLDCVNENSSGIQQAAGSEPRSCFPTEFSSFIRGNQPASALCQGKAGRFPDALDLDEVGIDPQFQGICQLDNLQMF